MPSFAYDFETATGDLHSACAVGMSPLRCEIKDEYYTLIQPHDNLYHGTTYKYMVVH